MVRVEGVDYERKGNTPIAVEPSLIASREYSTWNKRPSGENVLQLVSGEYLEI